MDKLELPLLHPLARPTPLDTLPDSTTRPPIDDLSNAPASPEEEEEEEEEEVDQGVEQEVVDLESYQPCVVDLTNEEEDDVEEVAVVPQEQSVIYLGTENRRNSLRRRNTNGTVAPPALEDLTRPDQQQHSIYESGGGDGGGGIRGPVPHMLGGERQQNNWLMDAQSIDFQDPNLVFGNLLNDYQLEGGDTHASRRHNPLREFRPNTRRQASRSRSPQNPEYTREGTRTPDIVQDVHEMQSEVEGRRPPPHPVSLVHTAMEAVAQEHNQRVAQIIPPHPPPSPPAREQPIIPCMVCLDSAGTIKETNRTLCSTVCGHIYCSTCIEKVVKQKKQCSVCRKKLTKKQYHPLFI